MKLRLQRRCRIILENISALVLAGKEVIVTKNGKEVGRFVPKDAAVSYLTDSLKGVLKEEYNLDDVKSERLREKYETLD